MFTLISGEKIPLEFHKARIVQKINLLPTSKRLEAVREGGFNTFLLKNRDVFLDMLTDSGVNAMSDHQLASMFEADDAYAGSQSFTRFEDKIKEIFGKNFVLPVHQGRAAENIISQTLVKNGSLIPMNYHFTTTKAHLELNGGIIKELVVDEGLNIKSSFAFKGNMDVAKLKDLINKEGADNIAFIRMEACTNLIGGQPFSLDNLRQISQIANDNNILLVLDASLLAENLHFIKLREQGNEKKTIRQITQEIADLCDIIYFSARKLGCARGGAIITNNKELFDKMKTLVTLYEGFLTYGGISVREIEAITTGLDDVMDEDVIRQSPDSIEFMVEELQKKGIPVVTPAGGLGCHIDAGAFLPHIKQEEYPSGALAAAIFIVSGIRGMERGTLSSIRGSDGKDILSDMELVRLALPRRVFTASHIRFAVDRIAWLFENRHLVKGLKFVEEPSVLRFFLGRLDALDNWDQELANKFIAEFGDNM
ncbi:MAG: tryptophanase [Lactobacillus sp.]|jgi:tryptophanase|nr:tryptophanase [Lactobacillus sp.]